MITKFPYKLFEYTQPQQLYSKQTLKRWLMTYVDENQPVRFDGHPPEGLLHEGFPSTSFDEVLTDLQKHDLIEYRDGALYSCLR